MVLTKGGIVSKQGGGLDLSDSWSYEGRSATFVRGDQGGANRRRRRRFEPKFEGFLKDSLRKSAPKAPGLAKIEGLLKGSLRNA